MPENIQEVRLAGLDINSINFKIKHGKRRMKNQIKMNKDQSEKWLDFYKQVIGDEISQDVAAKVVFFRGLNAVIDDINEAVKEQQEKEQAETSEANDTPEE